MRIVVYSPETTAAYAAVIETGLRGTADDMLVALRHLATMVHCDFTGELREPHTHGTNENAQRLREYASRRCDSCGAGIFVGPVKQAARGQNYRELRYGCQCEGSEPMTSDFVQLDAQALPRDVGTYRWR